MAKLPSASGLEFALDRIRARINLYDSPASLAYPDKAPAEGKSSPSNSVGLKSGE